MGRRIAALARRLESDAAFLAAPLAVYARSEALDDAGLAARLGCPVETLPLVRLCRRPRPDPLFGQDVERIADRFGLNSLALAEALRRVDALEALRIGQAPERGTLLAARDGTAPEPPEEPER